ncbi:MAG TPA: copper-binding protein [Bryobacteraceae bacterium]|nr:copper-binding protein [Bryobacteraceae bacterium]
MKLFRVFRGLAALLAIACLLAAGAAAQQAKGKSHTLEGKVEAVQATMLTVNHGKVEGYMDAMTMPYKVDKPDLLKSVKVGDQIKATVYDGDYTLYDVQVVPRQAKSKQK